MNTVTEKWAILWYQCLYANDDYKNHANNLIRGGGYYTVQSAFLDHKKIDDLFDDFGDVDDGPNLDLESPYWKEWFEPRRHLFMPDVKEVVDVTNHQPSNCNVLLDIPLMENIDETIEAVREALTKTYAKGDIQHAPKPKYQLRMENGRVAHGYEQVRQAAITAKEPFYYSRLSQAGNKTPSIKDEMIAFLQQEIDSLGWTLDPKARKDLMEKGVMSDDSFEIFKARINRCRRDFKAFSRNAIRGSFPDDRPYRFSKVWENIGGRVTYK